MQWFALCCVCMELEPLTSAAEKITLKVPVCHCTILKMAEVTVVIKKMSMVICIFNVLHCLRYRYRLGQYVFGIFSAELPL